MALIECKVEEPTTTENRYFVWDLL